jgi:hypothetical protein
MKLISVSTLCRCCGKRFRMDDTDVKHLCRCGKVVEFSPTQKQSLIQHELDLAKLREAEECLT